MTTYVIKMSLAELAKTYRAMGTKGGKVVERAAMRTAVYARQQLVMSTDTVPGGNPKGIGIGAVNIGHYRRSWKWTKIHNGVRIYNNAPYAAVIEEGRRPGKGVSREGQVALARWAIRKGLVEGKGKARAAAAKGVAFAISRALKKRGLKGRRVMGRVLDKIRRKWVEELQFAVMEAARSPK